MVRFMDKKGVSPIIATILLIVFAVTLGSVVISWRFNIDTDKSGVKCENVDFRIRKVSGVEICITPDQPNYLNFVIDNIGRTDISGFDIWAIGSKGTKLYSLDSLNISKDSLFFYKEKGLPYETDKYGSLEIVQFMPKVGTKPDTCPNAVIKADTSSVCTI